MPLSTGVRLGPYEILAPIGAGGMGEVWKARDTRLDRLVAVKVLPEHLAKHPESLARFEREAKAVAALNHPNITGIFDIGNTDGIAFVAMELLEGESLRTRLEQGPLAPRKATELAIQMAQGLAAAHEKGVVHRDLKPDNLWITKEGRLKILDFGLAKQLPTLGVGSDSFVPTAAIQASYNTEKGMILGTLGYMSPEQVRGEAVDARADLFSFGVVLFEMLTGKKAFARATASDTMAAILRDEPPEIEGTGKPIPLALRRIIDHCLEKAAARRFRDAHDVAFALENLSSSEAAAPLSAPFAPQNRRTTWIYGALAALLMAGIGIAGWAYWGGQGPLPTFHPRSYQPQAIFQAAFAPDGETVVYSAAHTGNVPDLFIVRPENPEPQSLGLPNTHLLSVSARGELAVLRKPTFLYHRMFVGTLARVPIGGAAPRELLENVTQADWSPDGSELAIIHGVGGKNQLEYPIGKVLHETSGSLSDLRVSPQGDRLAFFEHPVISDDAGMVVIMDRQGRSLWKSSAYPAMEGLTWSRRGEEVLFSVAALGTQMTIHAVDPSGRQRLALAGPGGLTIHDVSRSGRWLVTRDDLRYQISALPPGAHEERDLSWLDASSGPVISGNGRQVLFADESELGGVDYSTCLRDTDGGPVVRLGPGMSYGLSPDGKFALAVINSQAQVVLYPTGPGEPKRLPRGPLQSIQGARWFSDGRHVLIRGNELGAASRFFKQDLTGGLPQPLTSAITGGGLLTSPITGGGLLSPDDSELLVRDPSGGFILTPIAGGIGRVVPGLKATDIPVFWPRGDGGLYLWANRGVPRQLDRLDVRTGQRRTVRLIAPADQVGVVYFIRFSLSDDAKSYAYSYLRMTSNLFVVEGAR